MKLWRVKSVLREFAYRADWKRRCLWARITGRPVYCGKMPPGYYP